MKNILFYSLGFVFLTTLIICSYNVLSKKDISNAKENYTIYAYISENSAQPVVMLKRD